MRVLVKIWRNVRRLSLLTGAEVWEECGDDSSQYTTLQEQRHKNNNYDIMMMTERIYKGVMFELRSNKTLFSHSRDTRQQMYRTTENITKCNKTTPSNKLTRNKF